MSDPDHRPATLSRTLALLAGVLAMLAAATNTFAVALAAGGFAALLLGAFKNTRRAVDTGAMALGGGVVVGAGSHAVAAIPLFGAVATVAAWDLAGHAIDVGEQLGRGADTRRLELVHAGAVAAVGLAAATAGFLLYRIAFRDVALSTLVFLLFASILLMAALRE